MTSTQDARPPTGVRWEGKPDAWALLACLAVGLAMAVLPHGVAWWTTGSWVWLMNNDELAAYLPLAAQAYHHHPWRLGDAFLEAGGDTNFPSIQLVPSIVLAHALGLPVGMIPLVWRILAGLLVPAGAYLLARQVGPPRVAMALVLVLMADHGVIAGRVLDRHFLQFVQALMSGGDTGSYDGSALHQWRITPAMPLPPLLAFVGCLLAGRREGGWRWALLAGGALGLLFYSYFFFWTAAAAATGLLFLFDGAGRRLYFKAGAIGLMLGLPALWHGTMVKRRLGEEWFQRMETFVPIGRFSELILPPVAMVLLLGTVGVTWWRWRELRPLAGAALAAFLLVNNQVVTGLQFENFHWVYASGPLGILCFLALVWKEAERLGWTSRAAATAMGIVLAAHVGVGFVHRAWDATRLPRVREVNRSWHRYTEQRFAVGAPALDRRWRVAGDTDFGCLARIREDVRDLMSGGYYSQTVDARGALDLYALNQALLAVGEDRVVEQAPYRGLERDFRDPVRWKAAAERVRTAYRSYAEDPMAGLDRYGIGYVALPVGQADPGYLSRGWTLVQSGPHWKIWKRP